VIKTCYNNGQKERLCLIIDKCRRQKLCKRAQKISYIKYIHIAPFCSKPSAWLFTSFCIEIEKKKKSSSVHRQKEPPTTPPTRTTIYMTRHICFDILWQFVLATATYWLGHIYIQTTRFIFIVSFNHISQLTFLPVIFSHQRSLSKSIRY
jgi:hypothetical protein